MTESELRERYPPNRYSLNLRRHRPKTRFHGVMRPSTCHVLGGAVRFAYDPPLELVTLDVAELPGGDYAFEVVGDELLVLAICWPLALDGTVGGG
jgi:hypothetical protein